MAKAREIIKLKKNWWKEPTALIGFAGVVATIVIGLLTYWWTSRSLSHEYQERIKAARKDVVTAISRSIGEGIVPSKKKVQSVINSIRRGHGIKTQDFESPETIIDDVLVRVLANEFLDSKRREELSDKLIAVREEIVKVPDEGIVSKIVEVRRVKSEEELVYILTFFAMVMTLGISLFIFPIFMRRLKEGKGFVGDRNTMLLLIVKLIMMTGILLWWIANKGMFNLP